MIELKSAQECMIVECIDFWMFIMGHPLKKV